MLLLTMTRKLSFIAPCIALFSIMLICLCCSGAINNDTASSQNYDNIDVDEDALKKAFEKAKGDEVNICLPYTDTSGLDFTCITGTEELIALVKKYAWHIDKNNNGDEFII